MKGWSPERKVFAKMIVLDENRKKLYFQVSSPALSSSGLSEVCISDRSSWYSLNRLL